MASTSLAHPAHPSTPEVTPEYVWRGRGLVETYREELEYVGAGKWLIPSGSTPGKVYEVRAGSRPARSRCECQGFSRHGHCSHVVCVRLAAKKSAVCDGCGARRWWPDLTEVHEDDGLLAWFPGDRLCSGCIEAGYWT